jgi:hypothetical protein
MSVSRRVVFIFLANWMLLLALAGVARADVLEDGAKNLVARFAPILPRQAPIEVGLENRSLLSDNQVKAVRVALETELKQRGREIAGVHGGAFLVTVTISQNLQGVLLTAQFVLRENIQVQMVLVPMGMQRGAAAKPAYSIDRTLLWEQDVQLLDAAVVKDPGNQMDGLLVLDREALAFYGRDGNSWKRRGKQLLEPKQPWPRDLRGQLVSRGRSFEVHMPQMDCDGDSIATLQMNCSEDQPYWSFDGGIGPSSNFRLVAGRNFLTAHTDPAAEPFANIAPFFSVAYVQDKDENETWIFSSVDDRIHIYDLDEEQGMRRYVQGNVANGWGSDVARIHSSCDDHWLVIGTRPGDATMRDAITAYDVIGTTVAAVSQPLELPGPVTALWPREDSHSVVTIVKNLTTRRYEAYLLKISCRE